MAKKILLIFCSLVLLMTIIIPLLPLNKEEQIYENTLRLHILANSDKEQDQALKLKVRDKILEYFEKNSDFSSNEESCAFATENIPVLEEIARSTISEYGYSYPVKVTLSNEYYPTKEYKDVKMPSGSYRSLRVLIGDAGGHNWWCVLYPPLCTCAGEVTKTLSEAGFSRSQINILTEDDNPKYVAKFKILELFQKIFN